MNEVQRRCQCPFPANRITNAAFRCFPESPEAVTYRAFIHATLQVSTTDLVGFLQEWVASGASVVFQAQLLSADKTCAVATPSLNENECGLGGGSDETGEPPSPSAAGGLSAASIGTIVGVVAVVLVLVMAIVATIVGVLRHRRKEKKRKTPAQTPQR